MICNDSIRIMDPSVIRLCDGNREIWNLLEPSTVIQIFSICASMDVKFSTSLKYIIWNWERKQRKVQNEKFLLLFLLWGRGKQVRCSWIFFRCSYPYKWHFPNLGGAFGCIPSSIHQWLLPFKLHLWVQVFYLINFIFFKISKLLEIRHACIREILFCFKFRLNYCQQC